MAVAMANIHTGYLNKLEDNISQAKLDKYSQDSFTDLLRNNFQVLKNYNALELIQEFGKGNLLNPIQMNYLFVIEGKDILSEQINQARIQIEQSSEKLLDQIFGSQSEESLVRMTAAQYPKEKRVPFYYYKSQSVEEQSSYDNEFGVQIQKNAQKGSEYNLVDLRTSKSIGKSFTLQKCIKENFSGAKDYKFTKQGIYKIGEENMKLEINEQNAADVEAFLQDLCAVSRISNLFQESKSPNFVSFVLSYKSIQENPLVQELVEKMIQNASQNFEKKMGAEKVYGQTLIVNSLEEVLSEKVQGKIQPRILSSEGNFVALDSVGDESASDLQLRQIQFWFSVVFIVILFVVTVQMVKIDVGKDTLLYAKFIASDLK
ncbi:hypothetical protein PPERSA_00021 [Pseudocohnilembus persalinus]|uniref:Transmembrane protein n=1 Tax=Pseudocohnilembus persalinus TaxID=266149 RepID=A0A0V0QVM9_PSEPJ|nr:hypothetical protein PPERSA_00021 [Pseudocohnilembus persalinus]|eukprot:KRX06141.1 hypothetical protein PPERSA_00021 [Pseudocohnilembus persalinus]